MLKVRILSLGFTAAANCLVSGAISISYGKEKIFNGENNRVFSIDSYNLQNRNCDNIKWMISKNIKYVLVIQRVSMFESMLECSWIKHNCILVTGAGYPSLLCKELIHSLYTQMESQGRCLPIYCLVDCDPRGIEIFLSYQQGTITLPESYHYALPKLLYLGIECEDIMKYRLDKGILPMDRRDCWQIRLLKSLLDRKKRLYFDRFNKTKGFVGYLVFERVRKQTEMLEKNRYKMTMDNIDQICERYLLQKISEMDKFYQLNGKENDKTSTTMMDNDNESSCQN